MKASMMLYPVDTIDAALPLFVDGLGMTVKFRDGERYCALDGGALSIERVKSGSSNARRWCFVSMKTTTCMRQWRAWWRQVRQYACRCSKGRTNCARCWKPRTARCWCCRKSAQVKTSKAPCVPRWMQARHTWRLRSIELRQVQPSGTTLPSRMRTSVA